MILNIVIAVGINMPMYFINLWPGLPENGDYRHFYPFYVTINVTEIEMSGMILGNPIKISWQPYLLLSGCLYFFLTTVGLVVNKNSKCQPES